MTNLFWLLTSTLLISYAGDAYKILAVFPFPARSHSILGEGVVRLLLNAGHEVTYITPLPMKTDQYPKLRQISVSENWALVTSDAIDIGKFFSNKAIFDTKTVLDLTIVAPQLTYNNSNVQKLCKDPNEHFDLVIAEWMFSELNAIFAAIFNCPLIWLSTMDPHWIILNLIDQPSNPSYTADLLTETIPPFSFYKRVEQLASMFVVWADKIYNLSALEHQIYKDLQPIIELRGHEVPDFEELRFKASLVLGNSHVSLGSAIPLPQSYKPVGGYHIDPQVKELPEDLQKFMDNAKSGVIYFSMGTNLKSQALPAEVKAGLLEMFGKLKQAVIWKFEEALPDIPANVKILQWAPQHSILAHPNCVLFITHGGLLSTTETVHFGKPIIGIPVYGDQHLNILQAVKRGFAKQVDLSFGLAADLKLAIEEILVDPSYSSKAKELSQIYHHRPATPGGELVHWVEHVALTKGAAHLRSPALPLAFYQRYYLDLLALVTAAILAIYLIVRQVFREKKTTKMIKQKKH